MNYVEVITVLISTSAMYRLKPNKPWSLVDQRTFPDHPYQKGGNKDRNGDYFEDETICLAVEYLLKLAAENLHQHDNEAPKKTPLPKTSTSSTAKSSDF